MSKVFALNTLLLFVVLISTAGCSNQNNNCYFSRNGTWIDLSHDFSEDTIYWPTSEKFKLEVVSVGHKQGFYYEAYKFCTAEHGGTHADAPIHFSENGKSIDEIPIEQLVGQAIVIDVSKQCLRDANYQVTINDLQSWEKFYGRIPDHSILLLYTGYAKFWPDEEKYMGTNKRGEEGLAELRFPGLDPSAAEWLVKNRNIKAFGLDTASIDYGQSKDYKVHQILFASDIVAFENLANLDKLPATGAFVIALPMKIRGGSGGPTRIVAFIQ